MLFTSFSHSCQEPTFHSHYCPSYPSPRLHYMTTTTNYLNHMSALGLNGLFWVVNKQRICAYFHKEGCVFIQTVLSRVLLPDGYIYRVTKWECRLLRHLLECWSATMEELLAQFSLFLAVSGASTLYAMKNAYALWEYLTSIALIWLMQEVLTRYNGQIHILKNVKLAFVCIPTKEFRVCSWLLQSFPSAKYHCLLFRWWQALQLVCCEVDVLAKVHFTSQPPTWPDLLIVLTVAFEGSPRWLLPLKLVRGLAEWSY